MLEIVKEMLGLVEDMHARHSLVQHASRASAA